MEKQLESCPLWIFKNSCQKYHFWKSVIQAS